MKSAVITGITGQDGSYLAELLLAKGYEVHGVVRRASTFNTDRIDHIYTDPHAAGALRLHNADLSDPISIRRVLDLAMPDEVYHLGAQSHVRVSFDLPVYTAEVGALGSLRLFESVRDYMKASGRSVRVYQAGSSEMFGTAGAPQSESTAFLPRSPYAVSKLAAHFFAINYREAYGMFIANGILFNHESPRRGETFITRKITRAAGRIKCGLQDKLYLGNLEARRDWGFAGDYVEAMWRMLQHEKPDDFVIGTGQSWSVIDFLDAAFTAVDLDWRRHVEVDQRYFRPTEVAHLQADATKAHERLNWSPTMTFSELVKVMVANDVRLAEAESTLARAGYPPSSRQL